MYIELRNEIDAILQSEELSKELGTAPRTLNFQIEEPIERQFGLLATNVSFIFSKKIKEQEGKVISPQLIAEKISDKLNKKKFRVSVDGGGFINLDPTREFIRDYLVSDYSPINFEIKVNWDSVSMLEKIRSSDEALILVSELSKRGVVLSYADSLQLLSVVGDAEIDSSLYLRGFGGRENTPAYISKFEAVFNSLKVPTEQLDLLDLNPNTERLLLFRGRIDESVSRDHPERVMNQLLVLIRDFFTEFNRPTIRREISEGKNIAFLHSAQSCGKQVLPTLKALKFSCQLPTTVL